MSDVGSTHHVLSDHVLCAFLHGVLRKRSVSLVDILIRGSLTPVNLEPCDSRLLDEHASHKFLHDGFLRRVLKEDGVFIQVAEIVAYSEEFLAFVGSS